MTRRVRLHRRVGEALEALYGERPRAAPRPSWPTTSSEAPGASTRRSTTRSDAADRALSLMAYEEGASCTIARSRRSTCVAASSGDAARGAADRPRRRPGARGRGRSGRRRPSARGGGGPPAGRAGPAGARGARVRRTRSRSAWCERDVIDLVEEALAGCGDEPSAARAELLARASPWRSTSIRRERAARAERARPSRWRARVGDPAMLAYALAARHFAAWEPERLDERLALATELIEVAERGRRPRPAGRGTRPAGDRPARAGRHPRRRRRDGGLRPRGRRAAPAELPAHRGHPQVDARGARRALRRGREDVLATRRRSTARKRLLEPNTVQAGAVVLFELRRLQGRLDELRAAFESFAEEYPAVPAWRAALSLVYAEVGADEEARRELDALARDDVALLGRDANWLVGNGLPVVHGDPAARALDRRHRCTSRCSRTPSATSWSVAAGAAKARPRSTSATSPGSLGRYEQADVHFRDGAAHEREHPRAPVRGRDADRVGRADRRPRRLGRRRGAPPSWLDAGARGRPRDRDGRAGRAGVRAEDALPGDRCGRRRPPRSTRSPPRSSSERPDLTHARPRRTAPSRSCSATSRARPR